MSNQQHGWKVYSYSGESVTLTHDDHEKMPTFVPEQLIKNLKEKIDRLQREVLYLRCYGNKDCTAMADLAMKCGDLD